MRVKYSRNKNWVYDYNFKQLKVGETSIKQGQATKSAERMPWHWEPKKVVANNEMPRGVVSRHRSGDHRMEQSTMSHVMVSYTEHIGI